MDKVIDEIEKMLEIGIGYPIECIAWVSLIVFVPKKPTPLFKITT